MTMALHGELTDLWIDGEPVAKSRIHHMGITVTGWY